jgi:S1-C subfamily serine protease
MRKLVCLVVVGFAVTALLACGGGGKKKEPTATSTPGHTPETAAGLARSVVQIVALDDSDSPIWSGSGTVISDDGLILTNGHVVDDRYDEYAKLGIAVTESTDQPPTPMFLAEIVAVDYVLDLAVIQVQTDLDGNPATLDLPSITIGDSDGVEIGDEIRILGFPGIGGETITFTEGVVSGFTSQRDIADRAWIKTDATIAGGNSGGLAVNADGEIIGVPTIAGSSEEGEPVDCRFVADTNRDGTVDESDTCVPVGGFINGLRPVALAQPLIDAAQAGLVYSSPFGEVDQPTPGSFDTENVIFSSLTFAPDVTADDLPTEVVHSLPAGSTAVCLFWDYEGMLDDVGWEALWFVDGEVDEAGSIIDDTWVGGETGSWWVCNQDDRGLLEGLYEVALSVDGDFQASNAIFIGGDHPDVEFSVTNDSADRVCYAQFSPINAENWGPDDLGGEEYIEPGATFTFMLPEATYDMKLSDCDLNTLAEEQDIDLATTGSYTLE